MDDRTSCYQYHGGHREHDQEGKSKVLLEMWFQSSLTYAIVNTVADDKGFLLSSRFDETMKDLTAVSPFIRAVSITVRRPITMTS